MVDLDAYPCTCSDHARHSHDGSTAGSSSERIPAQRRASAPASPADEIMPAPLFESLCRCKSRIHDAIEDDKSAYVRSIASLPASSREDAAGQARSWRSLLTQLHLVPRKSGTLLARHMRFVGPGLVSSVAYFDPGNWSVDLQAGSTFGYKLLFVILMAGIGAAFLQVLSLRIGVVTSTSLATQIRHLFLRLKARFPKYGKAIMAMLYLIYAMAEIAIIATDLAELLGSAIALNLLFPKLPLFAGVLITAVDVLFVLVFFQHPDSGRRGMLAFEGLIVGLVMCVFICFIVLLVQIKPDWKDVFDGFLPSKTIFGPEALYTSVGIIGATVMPHGLFLGSHLATIDRLDIAPRPPVGSETNSTTTTSKIEIRFVPKTWRGIVDGWVESLGQRSASLDIRRRWKRSDTPEQMELASANRDTGKSIVFAMSKEQLEAAAYKRHLGQFNRIRCAKVHIAHATVDTVASLMGFAVTINAAILILGAAAFYFAASANVRQAAINADLFSAHGLVSSQIGKSAGVIFALALLCSGQSASITATLAGQVVSEGFIEWRTSPLVRRLVTRLLGIVPATVVAIAVGRQGIDTMLVASQVALSVVLPFIIFPLVYIAASKDVMTISNPPGVPSTKDQPEKAYHSDAVEKISFASHWSTQTVGYLLFALVTVANCYVLVELALGMTS